MNTRYVVTLGAFGFHVIDTRTGDSTPGVGCIYMHKLPVFTSRFKAQRRADQLNGGGVA
jgi:hypothetical protein